MTSITQVTKRKLAIQLVVDTVTNRIHNLRDESDKHWLLIANEILDKTSIQVANTVTRKIINAPQLTALALGVAIDNSWGDRPKFLQDHYEIHQITKACPQNRDPLDVLCMMSMSTNEYESGQAIRTHLTNLWNDGEPLTIKLPTMMTLFLEVEEDEDGVCHIDDGDTTPANTMVLRVDQFIPEDCTTKRHFSNAAAKIAKDASNIFTSIMTTIHSCRTEEAVIKVVPELEQYVNKFEKEQSEISSLISDASKG